MSKLIVVSNRVSLPDAEAEAGGLAVALKEALLRNGGIWCGWSGNVREYPKTQTRSDGNIDYVTQDLTQADYNDFYIGFSNSFLWPLFHYRMGLTHYSPAMFEGYENVNRQFAEIVSLRAEASDTIWVHDYHLLTLGKHLRDRGMAENRIGFFLHIPFPVPEVLSALPVRLIILEALCQYDLVGFQTEHDVKAFISCLAQIGDGSKITERDDHYEIEAFGRRFRAGCFPISIDTAEMIEMANIAENELKTIQFSESLGGRKLLIGVDRLDYTKGLLPRMEAYGHFLDHYPEQKGQVSYVQITPTSRSNVGEYRLLQEQVEGIAAHINGTHADVDWVPIRYVNKSFSRQQLAGFYRLAHVGLVTPLRDGMNLVAKEFVACQDALDPGVLLLSEFAGAACELDAALLVNPFDTNGMGEAMQVALKMSLEERQERHQSMMRKLHENTIHHWLDNYLRALREGQPSNVVYPAFNAKAI